MTTENMTTTGNDVTPKLLDVSAIPLIKHDILHNVKDSIDAIKDSITDDYKKELYDEIEKIKDEFDNTSLEDKLELLDKIKALQDKQSTASEAIDDLKQAVIRLEGGTDDDGNPGSVLNPEEITLLMKAALIEESFWTEDMIGAPSVLGKQIIGLVGLFGKVKASNITSDVIQGKTFQSFDKTKLVVGTEYETFDAEDNKLDIVTADGTAKGPAWQLREDGDGYLAAGRIAWDKTGDVTLTGVNISFNELVDVPDFTDGISIYTSTIFLRSNEEPAVPEGGSFSDPLPRISINNGIAWEDGIPEGDGVLWTSTRIFASDFTSDKNQSTWSEPRKLADDIDFEVIYGVEDANLGDLPTPEYVKENEGMKDYNGWYDEDKDAALQIIYMATSKKSEGKWSPWSISKIKGEDGQSINIVGIYQTLEQFKEEIAGPDLNNVPENVSYCYIVANDLYVWNITLQLWENVGRFNGKDGINAVSTFKSTVFKRSEIDLTSADRPEGGSWANPIPETEGWEDGIPEGTGAIWMSHRTFYDKGNDEYNELSFWSIPKKMIDTQSFEVIYGVEGADLDHDQLPTPEYVKQYEGLVNYNGWYDEDTNVPEDKEIWYMATAKNDNGKWSKWNISKIKGEKGGDGKSVTIFGSFDTLEEFQTQIAGINLDIRPDDISAAYVVAGDLYVWVENIGRWMNVGKFAGKDGKDAISQYKSIVYKRSDKELTAEDKPVGGIWEDSVPEGWSDGIPSGEGAIWMSYKIFYSDNSMNESTEWSIPEKMIDSQTFEVIYGTENANRNKLPKLPITEGLADTENGWYDDEYLVPAGEEIWYMATAKCDNNKWEDWSVAKIKGESGKDGRSIQIKDFYATLEEFKDKIAGPDLNRKPDDVSYCYVVEGDLYVWDAGELRWENKGQFTGKDAVSQYKSTVYKRSKTDLTKDDTPTGGSWDNPVPEGWYDGIPEGTGAIWSSYRMFYSDDNYTNNADWSIPKKMVDVAGQFEVIYGIEGAILQSTPELPIEEGLKDDINGWYDDDNLIPKGKEIWYMATATCKNGEWSGWTISKIKGESGDDGKSIQIEGYFETLDHFKEEIAGPDLNRKPDDVSYCYIVSGDLYVWDGSENQWEYRGQFSGKDSVGQFKSTAFTRFTPTDEKKIPDSPEGGNWEDPVPDTEGWDDGIPEGDGPIWMSYRVFYSDEEHNKDLTWSEPKLMSDSDGFEVIYGVKGASLSNDDIPTPEFVKENENFKNYEGKGWYDEAFDVPKEQEIWYMATSKKSEGKWSPWSISKIKGEDGNNGKSINIVQFYDTVAEFENNVDQDKAPNDPSDCYVVEGYLYVWDAGQNRWERKGQFTGSDGASTYIHIKYAKNIEFDELGEIIDIDRTDDNGESSEEAIWMGIGYDDKLEDPDIYSDIYKWTKIVVDPIITPVKFKSMAFARISSKHSDDIIEAITPTGGTYDKPWPDPYIGNGFGITWEDGIPKSDSEDTKIWMTTAMFYSDKDYTDPNTKVEWSNPRIMADVTGKFETAYGDSTVELNGRIDTSGLPKDDNDRAKPDGEFKDGWDDEPINGVDYPYMATATFEKGSWSKWKVVKIQGEKGEKGAGIRYKDTVNEITDLQSPPPNNEYDSAYIVKTNPDDSTDTQWNHLFAWTGFGFNSDSTATPKPEKTESGSWIYNGWSDTGKFNGSDGKDAYIYIKYAEHIEFDKTGNIVPEKCTLGSNSGEKKNRWMGIGNGFNELEPSLKEGDENYKLENWKQYNWIDLINEDLITELVTVTIGTYNISAEHIAGKTIDTLVTNDGEHEGTVELIEGTKFQEFEFVTNPETGKVEERPKEGDLTVAGKNTSGPAWQLRKDGAGYLAGGRIYWDKEGSVTLTDATMEWNKAWNDKIPDVKEQKFKSTAFARISPDILTEWPDDIILTGGTWDSPWPEKTIIGENKIEWSDGIPNGEYTLWATTRTFYSGNTTEDWSTPKILIDSNDFEVVYGTKNAVASNLPENPKSDFSEITGWYDEDTDVDSNEIYYMATNQMEGGIWKGWVVSKIKGEDGTGLSIKGEYETLDAFKLAIAGEDLSTAPSTSGDAYLVKIEDVNHLYVWISNENKWVDQGPFSGVPGQGGASAYIHEKYAVTIIFNNDNTVNEEESKWTDQDGENPGENLDGAKWYGYCVKIYSADDLLNGSTPNDPEDFDSYHWSPINVNENIAENVTTKLATYKITTNTIAGKTFHSTETGKLAEGTEYFAINEDGTFATTLKDGITPVVTDEDLNPITKETDTNNGPLWQIGWDGSGHLAGGNFRWDTDGNLDIAGKITVKGNANIGGGSEGGNPGSGSGSEGGNPGEVNIGSGVIVGPWKTFDNNDGVSYIGDATSTGDSTNYFGSDGTFKIGGNTGIFKEDPDGKVQISSAVEFIGSSGSGLTEENLNEWWDSTIIDGGKIDTGSIDADRINVDSLTVKKLNTTGSDTFGAGTISIEDNDISVNNKKYDYEILRITGDELSTINSSSINKQINSVEYNPAILKSENIVEINNISLFGINGNRLSFEYSEASIDLTDEENPFTLTFASAGNYCNVVCNTRNTWKDNYIYPNNGNGFNIKIASNLFITNVEPEIFKQLAEDGSEYGIIHPASNEDELKTFNMFNEDTVTGAYDNWEGTDSITNNLFFNKIYLHLYNEITDTYTSDEINQNGSITLPGKSKYYVMSVSRLVIDDIDSYINDLNDIAVREDIFATITLATPIIYLEKTITKCEISSYGFRYIVDENKYVEFTKNGNFKIKNGKSQFYLTDDKIYMGFNGSETREIVPKTHKFRLVGDDNYTMTVLTFGDSWEEDDF